ncbi:hypothetical protein THARTR1_07942 [Trichoderma harzianum]|uniref:SRm160/300 splicing coactivator n=1 Tax=Trichoderma harzianum TaxID=5544 RepID=A0A2K0U173_TRIHA|nr:hypothetical protein THARTR1_07942 [Trichoderma harzianum]
MTTSKSSSGDSTAPANPTSPTKNPDTTKDDAAADDKNTPGEGPKPAATGNRPRANTTKKPEPPTLLHDFLLGRPSPARLEAERKRRQSMDTSKAELRHEMRQNMVRKLQPPSGVKDRVNKWQKANAAAMADADPDDAATEPTDVAFAGEEMEDVTEEDRVRIKMRQKRRPPKKAIVHNSSNAEPEKEEKEHVPPPKKRIVSDDNWVKPKVRKASVRKVSPRPRKASNPTPAPPRIPNGFVFRSVPNPTFQSKVKAWAEKVVTPPPKSLKGSLSSDLSGSEDEYEDDSDQEETATEVTARKPLKPSTDDNDGIRVRPVRKKEPEDDGIRVAPMKAPTAAKKEPEDDGIRVAPMKPSPATAKKEPEGDGIRVTPMKASPAAAQDDGIRVKPMADSRSEPGTPRPTRQRSKTTGAAHKNPTIQDLIKAVEEATQLSMSDDADSYVDAQRQKPRSGGVKRSGTKRPNTRAKSADVSSRAKHPPHLPDSDLGTSLSNKSLADIPGDIPFGHSAFSELDLPLRGPPKSKPKQQQKRTKLDRATSLKAMPNVLKKVVEEGKKIIHDLNEAPRHAVPNNPPSIEKWLNNTVEPYDKNKRPHSPTSTLSDEDDSEDDDDTIGEATPRERTPKATTPKAATPKATTPKETTPRRTAPKEAKLKETAQRDTAPREVAPKETKHKRKPSAETKSSMVSESRVVSNVTSDVTSYLTSSTTRSDETAQSAPDATGSTPKSESKSRESLRKKTSSSSSLKRRSATRDSLHSKSGSKRRPFFGALKEAFQGESAGLSKPIKSYQSHEERRLESDDDDLEDSETESETETETETEREADSQYMQSNSELSSWVTTDTRSSTDRDSSVHSSSRGAPHIAGPRLRPPTNGHHELSTILSEGSSISHSESGSDVSHSTLTRSTTVTKSSDPKIPQRQGSGLKRRLTKHSDLVSVLSLPDDTNVPRGMMNSRSRPSLRKARGGSNVTADDLLKEFADDEHLYQSELKTLVDGVVPVLLSHVVSDPTASSDHFGTASPKIKVDITSKSVVNMGVALEKLKNAHAKAPLTDIRRMANWAHGVVPIYNNYLSVWRLGFQDLIVNLAPRRGTPDEDDSLLDSLPRNANGDLINAQGERVAVAYLLKRPLFRVKQMARLIVCVDQMFTSPDTNQLVKDFEALQEKARQRHREEVARSIDEEAANTDTTRARDLRTLGPTKSIIIGLTRQVSAKDIFSLDLAHSNGQRLECQVELVHRDNQSRPEDRGDLLIREVGDGRRSYLLFPPISMSLVSARSGDGKLDMVVMVRGNHNGKPWHELLNLWADEEEQILDWLDILPSSPVPPREPEPSVLDESELGSDSPRLPDVPVGVQSMVSAASRNTDGDDSDSSLSTPPTPTRAAPGPPGREKSKSHSGSSSSKQIPVIYHNDTPPPRPPVHRTLSPTPQQSPKSQSLLQPPVDVHAVRRRGSSPLKHEYLPSEVSSASGLSSSAVSSIVEEGESSESETEGEDVSGTESESSSSDEEMESIDIPQTELGYSIRDEGQRRPSYTPSYAPASEVSLTPSNSASQAGLHGRKPSEEDGSLARSGRCLATISRWSDKGAWKDVHPDHCSIVVTDGLIEAFAFRDSNYTQLDDKPIVALDLTPMVLIRQSTAVDLEIRSSMQPHSKLAPVYQGGNFRFRCLNGPDCYTLYTAVHHARLNNQKFIQLENEARFRSFGERPAPADDGDKSSRARSWFGRKNSYRSSVRAPQAQQFDGASTTPSSTLSASSFLKKLTLVGNLSFNLARSSVDKRGGRGGSGHNSMYTSGSSSGYGSPRSPSVSVDSGGETPVNLGTENIRIRLHLLVSPAKWEDYGNCSLQIRRPPPGWRQALRADHGLEKRVTVTTIPKKSSEKPIILLDAVLGSGCFTPMGSRGIVCGVWEEVKNGDGIVGGVPANGATGGNIKKWCFQFASVTEAGWVLRLVHQEVVTN